MSLDVVRTVRRHSQESRHRGPLLVVSLVAEVEEQDRAIRDRLLGRVSQVVDMSRQVLAALPDGETEYS